MREKCHAKTAVVTGAARGIGLAICHRLAAAGAHCVLVDLAPGVRQAAASVASPLGAAEGLCLDVDDETAVQELIDAIRERHGRLDILVNNAGIHPKHPDGRYFAFDEISRADWDRVLRVNLGAVFSLCKAALPLMREGGWGRIVNISSRSARTYSASAGAHYTASKAGVIALTRSVAGENGPFGITANCIAPGPTASPMAFESGARTSAYAATVPVRGLGTPEELAAAVAYLVSDEARYVNGAVLDFNGGGFMP